jgi:hypothetical protein
MKPRPVLAPARIVVNNLPGNSRPAEMKKAAANQQRPPGNMPFVKAQFFLCPGAALNLTRNSLGAKNGVPKSEQQVRLPIIHIFVRSHAAWIGPRKSPLPSYAPKVFAGC